MCVLLHPPPRIVALADNIGVEHALHLLKAGAHGYLCKANDLHKLGLAVQVVAHSDLYVSTGVAHSLIQRTVHHGTNQTKTPLTSRELEVLRLLALGHDDADIATMLCIAASTVKLHVAHMYDKLNIHKQAQLVAWAWQHGVVERG